MIGQTKTWARRAKRTVVAGLVLATLVTGTAATTGTAETSTPVATTMGTSFAPEGVRIWSAPAVAHETAGAIAWAAPSSHLTEMAKAASAATSAMTWVTVRSTGDAVRLRTFPTTGKVLTLIWLNERYLAWCYIRTPDGHYWAYSWAHGVKGWVRMDFMVSVDAEKGVYPVPC